METLEAATGQKLTQEQRTKLQTAADNLNRYGVGDDAYEANRVEFYNRPVSKNNEEARINPENSTFGVNLNSEQKEKFSDLTVEATEKELDRATGMKGSEAIPPSEERIALLSVVHHQPNAITPEMREALKNSDRAKVVEEIQKNERFANRRKQEADQFGRPNDPAIIRHDNNSQAELENQMRTTPRGTPNQKPGQPLPQPEPMGPSYDPNPTTVPPRPSILDGVGSVFNRAGQAISTAGRATFEMAMGLGKETLTQAVQIALSQGGSKETLKQAAQLAMGNMLASLNAQIMAKVQQSHLPGGYAGPLKNPMAVEDFMNSPRNQGVFEKIAEEVQRLLGIYPDIDAATVLVDQGLKHVRQGDFQIPGTLMLPDLMPMDRKGDHVVEILGVQLPIKIPEIIVMDGKIEENPQGNKNGLPVEFGGLEFSRGGNGAIQVRSYTREGATVRSHTRSRPDDDITNNLSYRVKA